LHTGAVDNGNRACPAAAAAGDAGLESLSTFLHRQLHHSAPEMRHSKLVLAAAAAAAAV